jgi:tetratricopeptide (TPR) repeat protein
MLVKMIRSCVAASLMLAATVSAAHAAGAVVETRSAPASDSAAEAILAGQTLVTEARRVADPMLLVEAERAFKSAIDAAPDRAEGYVGLASVALSRHRFGEALELGRTARDLAPGSAQPLGVLFDALIELGRYDEAGTAIEAMLKTRPDLPSLSRLSYFHELHGHLDLAMEAMEQAVAAGSADVEHTAFAQAVLGHLWLLQGDYERAGTIYRDILETVPGYIPALVGAARAAAAGADLEAATARLGEALAQAQEPAVMVLLGEALELDGDLAEAMAVYRDAVVTEAAHRASGEAPEPFGALLEADHGDAALAMELAERAYEHAPSIGSADAMAWAIFRSGDPGAAWPYAQEALRTGTLDPTISFHAGVIAAATGWQQRALELLGRSLEHSAAGPLGLRADAAAAVEALTE